jgi:hypothetical protein
MRRDFSLLRNIAKLYLWTILDSLTGSDRAKREI